MTTDPTPIAADAHVSGGVEAPLPPFVQPSRNDVLFAEKVVNSPGSVSAYASCEWDELADDGQVWMAAVIREAVRLAATPVPAASQEVRTLAELFCATPLPDGVAADGCATDAAYPHPRYGTNLLSVDQAEQMLRSVMAAATPVPANAEGVRDHVAGLIALAGLGTNTGEPRRPHGEWKPEEFTDRIMDIVPTRVVDQCFALADTVIAALTTRPTDTAAREAAVEAATVERCAKVAETVDLFDGDTLKNSDPRVTIAASIRALTPAHIADAGKADTAARDEGTVREVMMVINDMRRAGGAANVWADRVQDALEGDAA